MRNRIARAEDECLVAAFDGSDFHDHVPEVCNAQIGKRLYRRGVAEVFIDPVGGLHERENSS